MLLNSIKYISCIFVDQMDNLAVRGTSQININVQVYFFLDTFNNQEQFTTMCSTGKSISYRMTVTYFYKLTLQQYLFAHVQPVKLVSMERIEEKKCPYPTYGRDCQSKCICNVAKCGHVNGCGHSLVGMYKYLFR